jgi:hypothetical protein
MMISLSTFTLTTKEEDTQIGLMVSIKAILRALESQLLIAYGELS